MIKSMATVIPIRRARSRKIDLALALAMLGKSAKVYERAQRVQLAFFARSVLRSLHANSDANSLRA
jgi:hypothetical protein